MFYDFLNETSDEALLKKLGFEPLRLNTFVISAKNVPDFKKIMSKAPAADLVILNRPDDKVLKVAIDNCSVDAIDGFVNYPLILKMAERNIALIVNFNELLNATYRPKVLYLMQKTVRLAKKYKTPIIIVSGAKNRFELRSASELIAFAEVLGLSAGDAKKALYIHQEKLLEKIKLIKSGKYVRPGVKII
jgi:RNase P/RNase MRP subunit p30